MTVRELIEELQRGSVDSGLEVWVSVNVDGVIVNARVVHVCGWRPADADERTLLHCKEERP